MFSPDRYGAQGKSFGRYDPSCRGRPFPTLKTSFRNCSSGRSSPFGLPGRDRRTPLQKKAHFRFSEPSTPLVLKDRGWRPSDLTDPQKKDFLTHLTSKVFHLNLESGDEEPREKIPLERLFTPASDTENLIPLKKKRAFASSCFYRPDHPTIDDQVELAHKISTSLIDENNKSSRGQTMYMKRKNRSSKWIHEGGVTQSREAWQQETVTQEEKISSKEKPHLKLVLSPKKVQDFNAVQKHYEELMASSIESTRHITRMEVGKEIATHLESPTGKGAALFAKRKKRMDKFIVDESTIQQQQQENKKTNLATVPSQQSNSTSEQNNTFSAFESNSLLHENGYQNHDTSFGELNSTDQDTPVYKAEVKLVHKALSASPALEFSAPLSLHKLINDDDDFPARKEDKRKSFNLAPKGWGTYNNFYTPVHLEAK